MYGHLDRYMNHLEEQARRAGVGPPRDESAWSDFVHDLIVSQHTPSTSESEPEARDQDLPFGQEALSSSRPPDVTTVQRNAHQNNGNYTDFMETNCVDLSLDSNFFAQPWSSIPGAFPDNGFSSPSIPRQQTETRQRTIEPRIAEFERRLARARSTRASDIDGLFPPSPMPEQFSTSNSDAAEALPIDQSVDPEENMDKNIFRGPGASPIAYEEQLTASPQTSQRKPFILPDSIYAPSVQRPVIPPIITSLRNDSSITVEDFSARNSLRETIFSAMMAETLYPTERLGLLEDCRATVASSNLGVPFRDLLSEPMDMLGVPPLMYEIMSCRPEWGEMLASVNGYDESMEVVMYLVEHWRENTIKHGRMGSLEWCIRSACLRRLDPDSGNRIFQIIRSSQQKKDAGGYRDWQDDITVEPNPQSPKRKVDSGFRVLLNLPMFEHRLLRSDTQSNDNGSKIPTLYFDKKEAKKAVEPNVTVDFLASSRAWRLEIGYNSLKLTLVDDGDDWINMSITSESSIYVDARVNVILPTPSTGSYQERVMVEGANPLASDPIELFLPSSLMRPRSKASRGMHEIKLSPCFYSGYPGDGSFYVPRGWDDASLLHDKTDGSLSLELIVKLSVDPFTDKAAASNPCNAAAGPLPSNASNESGSSMQCSQDRFNMAGLQSILNPIYNSPVQGHTPIATGSKADMLSTLTDNFKQRRKALVSKMDMQHESSAPMGKGKESEYHDAERFRRCVDVGLRDTSFPNTSHVQEQEQLLGTSFRGASSYGTDALIIPGYLPADFSPSPLPSAPPMLVPSLATGTETEVEVEDSEHTSDFEDDDLYVQEGSQAAHQQQQMQIHTKDQLNNDGPASAPLGLSEVKSVDSSSVASEGEHVSSEAEDEWEKLSDSETWDSDC